MVIREHELPLRIVLRRPPAGVAFALQRGETQAGKEASLQCVQTADGRSDLAFDCTVRVRSQSDGTLRFLGPFTHGPTAGRFIYITVGQRAGQPDSPWDRRAKVPLAGISLAHVEAVLKRQDACVEAAIEGTLPDGSPTCATRPFMPGRSWTVRMRHATA